MKLSLEILKSKNTCRQGLEWYEKNPSDTVEVCVDKLISETDTNCPDRLNWASWLLTRMFTKEQNVKYAIFAAKQVIGIYEKKYPNDKRPRKAIEAAKEYLKNTSDKNKKAAYAAAAYAAYAANAAAYAAATAAYAAYTAASAAYSAASANAATSAAYTAASAASATKYRDLLLTLIETRLTAVEKLLIFN